MIIGSGPAGYTAGVYAARAKLEPLILAGEVHGGQLMNTTLVENWPGVKAGILGPQLMLEMREQAAKFGAEILDKNVSKVDFSKALFRVWSGENEYQAEAVIITTGAASIYLGVPGEKEFLGRGVATCAVCDAAFYKEKIAAVIGGGDAACEDTLALTKYAKQVYLIVRRDQLRASKIMAERVINHPKVKIFWNSELKSVLGSTKVEKIQIVDNKANKEAEIVVDGVFLAIGHKPTTEIFQGKIDLDEKGFIKTQLLYPQKPGWLGVFPTMTMTPGIFAAGDVVDHRYKQAITAAGMGCMAALDVEKWLESPKNQ